MNDPALPTTSWQPQTPRWSPELPLTLSDAPDLSTAATMLAGRDIPVFPCAPRAKQPQTNHGFRDATTDLPTVRKWWHQWPDANIGMPTGAASGVDVIDVDVHQSGNGFTAFEQARSADLAQGWAWLVRTPSGGLHAYYLRVTPDEQRSWQVPSKHVDFRGDGGYIIVPPSRVATSEGQQRRYELIAVAQHRPQPLAAVRLRAFLEPSRPARAPSGVPARGARPDKLAAWVASRPEGARNHGLFWAACRMVEEGHTLEATASVLGDAARSAGLSDQEAQTSIRSAYRITSRLGGPSAAGPTPAAEPSSRAVGL